MSSFGYSGTLAHAVLCGTGRDIRRNEPPVPPAYRRRAVLWREPPHPFVKRLSASSVGGYIVRSPAAGALHALVADHVVQGRVIFPGAAYLELARAAAPAPAALRGVYFLQPLAVEAAGLHVECAVADGRFEVRSGEDDAPAAAVLHCSGALAAHAGWQRFERAPARVHSCVRCADVVALYDSLAAVGLQYGPGYRTLVQAWGGAAEASARLRARSTRGGTAVHAADLDDALCASALAASGGGGGETRLPFAVDGAQLQGSPGELWAVRCLARSASACERVLTRGCVRAHRLWRGRAMGWSRCGSARLLGGRRRSSTGSSRAR